MGVLGCTTLSYHVNWFVITVYFFSSPLSVFFPSAALIQQATTVRKKDIRKFLDDIYVSEKGTVVEQQED